MAKVLLSAACGAANGLVAASGISGAAGGLIDAATGYVEALGHELIDCGGNTADINWDKTLTKAMSGAVGGAIGGNGAISTSKYMLNQTKRFTSHVFSDGLVKAGSFFYKMTDKYSRAFIKPTIEGIARSVLGEKAAYRFLG